jgi:hypothetical protein
MLHHERYKGIKASLLHRGRDVLLDDNGSTKYQYLSLVAGVLQSV